MATKIAPCISYPNGKHKWVHVRNVELRDVKMTRRGTTVHIRAKGQYKCICGERKLGATV